MASTRQSKWLSTAGIVLIAMALVSLGLVLGVLLTGDNASTRTAPPVTPTPTPEATSPGTTPSPTPSPKRTTPPAKPTPTPTTRAFRYVALWPFATKDEAAAWQARYRSGGHQPWHLDAELTASYFTTRFLGFTGVDKVVSSSIRGDQAWVTVGYDADGTLSNAATLHLARFGDGDDAPWEVVGSRDTTLTLDHPRYAARITSPVRVSGLITGVDESLRVQVRQLSSGEPLGEVVGIPAGGVRHRWSATVSYNGESDPAQLIVVSTGGHFTEVERFALTGAYATLSDLHAPNWHR